MTVSGDCEFMKQMTKLLMIGCLFIAMQSGAQTEPSSSIDLQEDWQHPARENKIRIAFKKDAHQNLQAYITDISGYTELLNFGNFISYLTEIRLGKDLEQCKATRGKSIKISLDKSDTDKTARVYFTNVNGEKKIFSIDNLLVDFPQTLDCTGKEYHDDLELAPNSVNIYLQRENGRFQAYITHVDGRKELLTLGSLLNATAELFPNCQLGTEVDRTIDVTFINPGTGLKAVQVDAYGKIENLDFDHLIVAAAETLQTCEKEPSKKTLVKIPQSQAVSIKFKKNANGKLESYLITSANKTSELNLGTLLSNLAMLKKCTQRKNQYLDILFEKNENGVIPIAIDANGKKKRLDLLEDLANMTLDICAD